MVATIKVPTLVRRGSQGSQHQNQGLLKCDGVTDHGPQFDSRRGHPALTSFMSFTRQLQFGYLIRDFIN